MKVLCVAFLKESDSSMRVDTDNRTVKKPKTRLFREEAGSLVSKYCVWLSNRFTRTKKTQTPLRKTGGGNNKRANKNPPSCNVRISVSCCLSHVFPSGSPEESHIHGANINHFSTPQYRSDIFFAVFGISGHHFVHELERFGAVESTAAHGFVVHPFR